MANGMLIGGIVVVVIIVAAGAYFVLSNPSTITHPSSTSTPTTTSPYSTTSPTTVIATTTPTTTIMSTTSTAPATTTAASTTTVPAYQSAVNNGNFSTGTYSGWTVNGTGFGTAPLGIKTADADMCYYGAPWANYNGSYFATTFTCGTQVSPGNLTSGYFTASAPYLNFRIISPASSSLYIEILYNGVPRVINHYNTYNSSISGGVASYTFFNASIPLASVQGNAVQVRIVAADVNEYGYIAVGDFGLAQNSNQAKGILVNTTTG